MDSVSFECFISRAAADSQGCDMSTDLWHSTLSDALAYQRRPRLMSNCIALSTEVLVNIHMRANGFWQKPIR